MKEGDFKIQYTYGKKENVICMCMDLYRGGGCRESELDYVGEKRARERGREEGGNEI